MPLKPWYKTIEPREDLRDGRPLDASEFAVHLDKVRDGTAQEDYRNPERFFDRTYLTTNLTAFGGEVIRRLSGIKTETSAVFSFATHFGGGKTHALTMLYHLAKGKKAKSWKGVDQLLDAAGVTNVPEAAVATFVGTEFDSLTGRGGQDGTPVRKTPWGEIAWQLGGEKSFKVVAEHEKTQTPPAGEVIRQMLPRGKPVLILMDELINYVSRTRKSGLGGQLYHFLQNLSETARGEDNIVLAASVPASELEMTADDQADYTRFKKLLDRLGKAVVMSAEHESSEIIRRRLFNWGGLPSDAKAAAAEYAHWVADHRKQLPQWFPTDHAREQFEASYPFHPVVLSVFERKWQSLPRFQQTRGVLRLLALWVSHAYAEGYKGAHKDALIGLGSAPLKDPMFRTAVFEQLGEDRLDSAVTTDICGKKESHAVRLDAEAVDTIRKARLHQKVATVVFFESNGGQAREGQATVPEIRLAVGEPDLDIGNVETALEALTESCYFLKVEGNKYRFGLAPNLNKLLADRRAGIAGRDVEDKIREQILKAFEKQAGIELVPFPEKSGQITDRPVLSLAIMPPNLSAGHNRTPVTLEEMVRTYGSSNRTYKSAVIFSVPDDATALRDEARKLLAWQVIKDEEEDKLDSSQRKQLGESLARAERDLREAVWRTYKNIVLLGKDGNLKWIDLGLVHSSSTGGGMTKLVIEHLKADGDLESNGVSPNFLVRNWPPAFAEWSTRSVRDAFFASPLFPRLLGGDTVRETIAKGVSNKILGYVGKQGDRYEPFHFDVSISADDVEISEEMFIVTAEQAKKHIEPPELRSISVAPEHNQVKPGAHVVYRVTGRDQHGRSMPVPAPQWSSKGGTFDKNGGFTAGEARGEYLVEAKVGALKASATVVISKDEQPAIPLRRMEAEQLEIKGLRWTGEVPAQKWMNFYTKVLSKYATSGGLKVRVSFEVAPDGGLQPQRFDETKSNLRELGLDDDVEKTE